jgi:hypothetical protein
LELCRAIEVADNATWIHGEDSDEPLEVGGAAGQQVGLMIRQTGRDLPLDEFLPSCVLAGTAIEGPCSSTCTTLYLVNNALK